MILGLNTAIEPYSLALLNDRKQCLFSLSIQHRYHLTEDIMPTLKKAVEQLNTSLKDITAIGVVHGPGSYSGLRIGIVSAKTLADILDIPIYGFSAFEAMLKPYIDIQGSYILALPARRHEINLQLYACSSLQSQPISDMVCFKTPAFKRFLAQFKHPISLIGLLPEAFEHIVNEVALIGYLRRYVMAESVASLACEYAHTHTPSHFPKLKPRYSHEGIVK